MSGRVKQSRRALEGGTLLPDFLGDNSFLPRVARAERLAQNVEVAMLSSLAASSSYTRRFGSMMMTGWGRENVAASLSNVELSRFGQTWQAALTLPFAGAVRSLIVWLSSGRTGGTLTVKVYIDGADSGLWAVIDADNPLTVGEFTPDDSHMFEAGMPITLRVATDSGWSPTSADLMAMIEVTAQSS